MVISHQHRFVFIHVPKTGGDSITAALRPFASPEATADGDSPDKHLTACEIRRRYIGPANWPDYFSFAFVRNPWEWLHSDYWFSVTRAAEILRCPNQYAARWVEKLRRVRRMTFADFVRTEWTTSPIRSYCQEAGCDIVTFIGRYENLAADFLAICQQIGLPAAPPLPHHNATLISGTRRYHYREDYTPHLRNLVAKRFDYEIARFDYVF